MYNGWNARDYYSYCDLDLDLDLIGPYQILGIVTNARRVYVYGCPCFSCEGLACETSVES